LSVFAHSDRYGSKLFCNMTRPPSPVWRPSKSAYRTGSWCNTFNFFKLRYNQHLRKELYCLSLQTTKCWRYYYY